MLAYWFFPLKNVKLTVIFIYSFDHIYCAWCSKESEISIFLSQKTRSCGSAQRNNNENTSAYFNENIKEGRSENSSYLFLKKMGNSQIMFIHTWSLDLLNILMNSQIDYIGLMAWAIWAIEIAQETYSAGFPLTLKNKWFIFHFINYVHKFCESLINNLFFWKNTAYNLA